MRVLAPLGLDKVMAIMSAALTSKLMVAGSRLAGVYFILKMKVLRPPDSKPLVGVLAVRLRPTRLAVIKSAASAASPEGFPSRDQVGC